MLTIRQHTRPGKPLISLKAIIIHYTASPGATAKNVFDYFQTIKRYASSHYIVGLDGEVLMCIPPEEVAWHCGAKKYTKTKEKVFGKSCNNPNYYSIGIELCHLSDGIFTEKTLFAAADLVRSLPEVKILRHWDVTGKRCPGPWAGEGNILWDKWLLTIR